MKRTRLVSLGLLGLLVTVLSQAESWQRSGEYAHPAITESSGIAVSRLYGGVYWTMNDSAGPPSIYATTRTGELIREFRVDGATNRDWEALAIDDESTLWIGDIGNNMRRRETLTVYAVEEPNPFHDIEVRLKAIHRFRYPEGSFDAEAMFVAGGLPYIVTKTPLHAVLYRFESLRSDEVQVLKKVGEVKAAKFVTGADISPDGARLAFCTYNRLWLYEIPATPTSDWPKRLALAVESQPVTIKHPVGGEAVGFDGENLVMTNERRGIYVCPTPQLAR